MRSVAVLGLSAVVTLSACGGGGDTPPAPPPPNPLFVRVSGRDTNTGGDPANALRTVTKAAQIARSGYTIIVGPGTYGGGITTVSVGAAQQGLVFIADVDGTETGDGPGPVAVDATGTTAAAGFSLSNTSGTLIDGFTITGGGVAGIVIKSGSTGFTIRNCVIENNPGDGIRVQDSSGVLVFNNLVHSNGGTGIAVVGTVSGSSNAQLISNTVFGNGGRGIVVGNTEMASPGATIRNNIIQDNGGDANIKVFAPPPTTTPRSDVGYVEDYNLVFPPTYLPDSLAGANDVRLDAAFANVGAEDFRLRGDSPAIDAGSGEGLPDALVQTLRARSTTGTGVDTGPLDLGFHQR